MQGSNNSVQSKIREYLDASCAAFKFTESLWMLRLPAKCNEKLKPKTNLT
jgi:hypothetical protein